MPEPDFDQIAQQIVVTAFTPEDDGQGHLGKILNERWKHEELVKPVAEQLRQVWNARGAADIAKCKALRRATDDQDGDDDLTSALRTLDR